MVTRVVLGSLTMVALVFPSRALGAELRQAPSRPEVIEVGEPSLISRELLEQELGRNSEMREYVALYGWPDYAEVQEVTVQEPLAPYEVRLYYLSRNHELAFARVNVSPALNDFGIRTYEGPIDEATLGRILTARGEAILPREIQSESPSQTAASPAPEPEAGLSATLAKVEAAADRAALAAEMAERASGAAKASAERATAILEKMAIR